MRSFGLLPLALLAACATPPSVSAPPAPVPTPVVTTTKPVPHTVATWAVGASALPLRADGFGTVLPTPKLLRNRRLQAKDTLPAPRDELFHASTGAVTAAIRQRMADTYRPGCPVPLDRLSYLQVTFRGFDHRPHTGELVVASSVAPAVARIFRDLYAQGFPIEQMRLPTTADVTARPTGDGNDTAAFVCRAARGTAHFSAHAYGLALDLNPFQNPESKDGLVLPELASAYTDRRWERPGMIIANGPAARAFTREGWTWGGSFHSLKDYMHFSENGQ